MSVHELARRSDPDTSHLAAVSIAPKLNRRAQQFLDGLIQLGEATSNEVARLAEPNDIGAFNTVRRRASDLHKSGLVAIVGTRRCDVTGHQASVYAIAAGRGDESGSD